MFFEILPLGEFQQPLGVAYRLRRFGGDFAGELLGCRQQFIWRGDFEQDAQFFGFIGLDDAPGQGQFGRALVAEQAIEKPGTAITGDDAEIYEGFAELRLGGADTDVAHIGEVETGADGGTVDGCNHRDLGILQCQRDALDSETVIALQFMRRRFGALAHGLDVATGRKSASGAGDDQHRNIDAAVGPLQGVDDIGYQLGAGKRIAHLVAVEGQNGDAPVDFEAGICQFGQVHVGRFRRSSKGR